MEGDSAAIGDGERQSFYFFAARILHDETAERSATRSECGKNTRVNLIE